MGLGDAACSFSIRLFGPFEVCLDGRPLPRPRFRKSQAVLALLVLRRGAEVEREWLAGLLWPDSDPGAGLHNLRNCLTDLRQALGPEAGRLETPTSRTLRLHLAGSFVDVLAVDAALSPGAAAPGPGACEAAEEAVRLYRGPLLEGWTEEWVFPEREAREHAYLAALEGLAARAQERGDTAGAERHLRRAAAVDPSRETAQRALMQMLAASGNYAAASQVYGELRRHLHRELNSQPAPETRHLFEQIRAAARPKAEGRRQKAVGSRDDASARPPAFNPSGLPSAFCLLPSGAPPPAGGALPLDSRFYIDRLADAEFRAAVDRRDSIVRVHGPRQSGKSSLLARGLEYARDAGAQAIVTDLQVIDRADLEAEERFFPTLAACVAQEIDLGAPPHAAWQSHLGAGANFERYLRLEVLGASEAHLVWGIDEVDRLFASPCAPSVFGLFRSWHNRRGYELGGPWSGLTLALAHAAEAHLAFTDLNQSPFNVGTQLTLSDFTPEQVAQLNHRYGSPLRRSEEIERFCALVGGHPFLVQCGLWKLANGGHRAKRGPELSELEAEAETEEGVFADHLRRMLMLLIREKELTAAVRAVLRGEPCPNLEEFYRLRSIGILAGASAQMARLRCPLYQAYLARHLL